MEGTKEIDELMRPVLVAIKRHLKDRDAITEIYNRAYEAVYISTEENDTLRAENERLLNENKELNIRIENLTMSPDHRVRVQAVKHMLEMTAFLRKIMTLGLLRGSPRLRDEALRILDGVEPSNYDGSATQNTNPDFNNH